MHVQNFGASWGIFGGQTWLLIVISLVVTAVLLWFYIKKIKNSISIKGMQILLSVTIGFIVGGCLGNLYDRLAFGYVRDFINFQFIDFPVFNIADSAITIGVVLFIVYFIIEFVREAKLEKAKKEAMKQPSQKPDSEAEDERVDEKKK